MPGRSICLTLALVSLVSLVAAACKDAPAESEKAPAAIHAQRDLAALELQTLRNAAQIYLVQYGTAPVRIEDLIETPDGHPIIEKLQRDPWGTAYRLDLTDERVIGVRSAGPDGAFESDDDLTTPLVLD